MQFSSFSRSKRLRYSNNKIAHLTKPAISIKTAKFFLVLFMKKSCANHKHIDSTQTDKAKHFTVKITLNNFIQKSTHHPLLKDNTTIKNLRILDAF